MEVNDLRIAVTLTLFVAFLAVVIWAWRRERRPAFEAAARLPFEGDEVLPAREGERR